MHWKRRKIMRMASASKFDWKKLFGRLIEDVKSRHYFEKTGLPDTEAWEELLRWLRIYSRYSLLILYPRLSTTDVEDILQDIILKLQSLETLKKVYDSRNIAFYLKTMIRNTGVDYYRRQKQHSNKIEQIIHEFGQIREPREERYDIWRIERLEKEMKLLSKEEKELLRMVYWEELNIGEIAQKMGVKYSAIATRLFRLLRKLKRQMNIPN